VPNVGDIGTVASAYTAPDGTFRVQFPGPVQPADGVAYRQWIYGGLGDASHSLAAQVGSRMYILMWSTLNASEAAMSPEGFYARVCQTEVTEGARLDVSTAEAVGGRVGHDCRFTISPGSPSAYDFEEVLLVADGRIYALETHALTNADRDEFHTFVASFQLLRTPAAAVATTPFSTVPYTFAPPTTPAPVPTRYTAADGSWHATFPAPARPRPEASCA